MHLPDASKRQDGTPGNCQKIKKEVAEDKSSRYNKHKDDLKGIVS